MNNRTELNNILKNILGVGRTVNVYYQPPETIKMKYPAIVYNRSDISNRFASNSVYTQFHFYEITVIDSNPDSEIVEKVSKLPSCKFNRHFTSDNLNHDVFTIFY